MTHKPIAVLINADIEWQAVKEILQPQQIAQYAFGEWFPAPLSTSSLSNPQLPKRTNFLFFHGGWGKISAAVATQYLIDHWKPPLIINIGTCGGIAGKIDIGTIVLVERAIVYDIHEKMGDQEEHIRHYQTKIDLSWLRKPYPQEVLQTTILSADRDLDIRDIDALFSKYHAFVADWESASIAFVCARNNQRLLILRGVSDVVSSSAGEAYGNLELFRRRAHMIMQDLIHSLPAWVAISNIASTRTRLAPNQNNGLCPPSEASDSPHP